MSAKVLKNSAIYTTVALLQRSAGFLLLPVYTFFLPPDDYGNLSVILSISNFVSIIMLLAIPYATARFNFKVSGEREKVRMLWGNNLLLVLISAGFTGMLLIVFHSYLVEPFAKGIAFYPLLFISILTTMLNPLYVFYQSYLQTGQNGKRYGLNILLNFTVNTGLIILFVVVLKQGVQGILLANLITAFLFAVYVLVAFLPQVRLRLNRSNTKQTLRYSLPLIPHSLSFWAVNMTDRMFLFSSRGAAETGVYSVGSQVGGTMNVITSAVNQAWSPWFYDVIRDPERNIPAVVRMSNIICSLYCLMALAISFFSREIILLLAGEQYIDAWKIIPLTAFACVLIGYYHFFANVILLEEKTKHVAMVSGVSAACSIAMNLLVIPAFGATGAAVSMLVSYFVTSLLALLLSRKFRRDIRFSYTGMYVNFLLTFLASLFAYGGDNMPAMLFLALKTIILFFFIAVFILRYKSEVNAFVLQMKAKFFKIAG